MRLTIPQKNIAPRYEFGFGLSYTTFDYAKVTVSGSVGSYTADLVSRLHANAFTVSFTLTNNGTRAGHEIPQVMLSSLV
jgi:beta-glucosidase